ncbi:PAS-domain containing protein [Cereibacter azotoformans]|uniref:PAS-domain containing protein n=1 Tax=Cereibacter azotoformans TaxID=43057 RepID=UPI003B21AC1A
MEFDWALALGLILTAAMAASAAIVLAGVLQARSGRRTGGIFSDPQSGTVFLFDGETLLDATPGARAILALSPARGGPWLRLLAYLVPRFPDLESRLATLAGDGRLTLASTGEADPLLLMAEMRGGVTRLTLDDPTSAERPRLDHLAQRALVEELDQLRATVSQAPLMMWRESGRAEVIWANAAYLLEAAKRLDPGEDLSWPLPRLFERAATAQGAPGQRQKLETQGTARWFELVGFAEGEGRLLFALPADAAVQAEASLRDFMQTLAKTFAHLPIGLAIFDQHRKLALFNPALLDLTSLPPDMLALQPSLFSFLEALRDRQMIPEPKDYPSWRRQILELEKAASSGLYTETWSLPSGQTYRVIGRPHPNGALALMFEDISTEMSRTRRYRADLELGQAVVDAMDEAIAVFSQAGELVMTNAAYGALWGHDPVETVGSGSIVQLCEQWRARTAPSPLWSEAERFVADLGSRRPWSGEVRLDDGRLISCRFSPLTGGATLVLFRINRPDEGASAEAATLRRA